MCKREERGVEEGMVITSSTTNDYRSGAAAEQRNVVDCSMKKGRSESEKTETWMKGAGVLW